MSEQSEAKANSTATNDSPLETLTTLVLDAADAANDSAQATQEAISRLSHVVDTNLETTRAVRNAPAIFGAIMMSVGIVMAVVVAMVFSKMNERAAALDAAIIAQNETLEKVEETLKGLSTLEGNLEKFQKIADDTTQRAIVTLREQVKTDRVALQQLEVRRLNEMLASLRGAVDAAPRAGASRQSEEGKRFSAIEKSMSGLESSVTRIDQRLSTMEKQSEDRLAAVEKLVKERAESETSSKRPVAVLSDAQAKDMKATVAEVSRLKSEIASLRELIERRRSELQSGEPAIRK
ncbi:MAG: hypothetical protein ACKO42_07860 [Gammaproteobacteria bacterium]